MTKKMVYAAVSSMLLVGCASVPMESKESSDKAKVFGAPSQGSAGLYIYRAAGVGGALKKDIWIDGQCVGESAPNVFFYEEVAGDKEHVISTESEFSPNELKIVTASNQNYFVEQYIKMGVFVGGANLKVVDEASGKAVVQQLKLATKGTCSK
jgi:hypothetical protein